MTTDTTAPTATAERTLPPVTPQSEGPRLPDSGPSYLSAALEVLLELGEKTQTRLDDIERQRRRLAAVLEDVTRELARRREADPSASTHQIARGYGFDAEGLQLRAATDEQLAAYAAGLARFMSSRDDTPQNAWALIEAREVSRELARRAQYALP